MPGLAPQIRLMYLAKWWFSASSMYGCSNIFSSDSYMSSCLLMCSSSDLIILLTPYFRAASIIMELVLLILSAREGDWLHLLLAPVYEKRSRGNVVN